MTRLRPLVRWVVAVIVVVHGLIHLLGAGKGLGWGEVSRLKEPISTSAGSVWLVAAVLMVVTGVMLAASIRWWWIVGNFAVVVSQGVIATSWTDAKAGTIVNVVLLAAVVHGTAANGRSSLGAEYRRRVATALTHTVDTTIVTEDDLAALPAPVAAYVRRSGAVGRPHVSNFRADFHGRIRGGPTKPWMEFTGQQVNTFGANPSRSFHMDATMRGLLPVDVLHIFADATATMRVKACSLFTMVNASGPDMDLGETVTVFNDLCVFAPAAIADAPIAWQPIDDHHARATFTNGTQVIAAELTFNDECELIDFVSDDRMEITEGTTTSRRWSTPISAYRTIRGRAVGTVGEARWHALSSDVEFVYLELHLDDIAYNIGPTRGAPHERISNQRMASRSRALSAR